MQFVSRQGRSGFGTTQIQLTRSSLFHLKTPHDNGWSFSRVRNSIGDYEYLPRGLQEPGEAIESNGRRELTEETGLELTHVLAQPPVVIRRLSAESAVITFVESRRTEHRRHGRNRRNRDFVLDTNSSARCGVRT